MLKKIWSALKENPTWILLGLAMVFAGVNILFLGGRFQKEQLKQTLTGQVEELQASIEELEQADMEGLQALEDELSDAQSYLSSIEAIFPDIESPFDLYRRGYSLASSSNVDVTSIHRMSAETQPAILGTLELVNYAVVTAADLESCLQYLGDLESEGAETLALNNIRIEPALDVCNFEVRIAGIGILDAE
jgi:hypothetical protein